MTEDTMTELQRLGQEYDAALDNMQVRDTTGLRENCALFMEREKTRPR